MISVKTLTTQNQWESLVEEFAHFKSSTEHRLSFGHISIAFASSLTNNSRRKLTPLLWHISRKGLVLADGHVE